MNPSPTLLPWWELHFSCSDPDDFAAALISAGAAGAHLTGPHHVTCYLQADSAAKAAFCLEASHLGASLLAESPVEEKNWTEDCPELWEPLRVGEIDIIPVQSADSAPDCSSSARHVIRIIPGTGFGTGHHPSTAMIIELMQASHFTAQRPRSVLDVGTGSGILAVAASKLFEAAVTATDIDPLALSNAVDNARLNECTDTIQFSDTRAAALSGKFDLILANIYAEVLQSLRPDFERLLAPHGTLIVSGIMLPLATNVQQDFERAAWRIEKRLERSGWVSLELRRSSATKS